jgi:hypothetical protein
MKKYGKSGGHIPTPKVNSTPPRGKEIEEMGRKGTKDLNHNGTSSHGK